MRSLSFVEVMTLIVTVCFVARKRHITTLLLSDKFRIRGVTINEIITILEASWSQFTKFLFKITGWIISPVKVKKSSTSGAFATWTTLPRHRAIYLWHPGATDLSC